MTKICNTEQNICENVYDYEDNNSEYNDSNCITSTSGNTCKPWQITLSNDNCIIDEYVQESLNIAAADINVFKLLGVHEQTKLVDLIGNGKAISSGDQPGYSKDQGFTAFTDEWRSIQRGSAVTSSAFIGYDFGVIKLDNQRRRYGSETHIKHNISTIKIKQSNDSNNRVTKCRVERSEDGTKWFGCSILNLPDDDCLNTIHFNNTVPMRYWRLRPIVFNGNDNDFWAVQALQMFDYNLTRITNIQDKIWNENRDRDYAEESIKIKGFYELQDVASEMARFGLEISGQILQFQVNFRAVVGLLGRPIVIGDIFEVPSEQQYNTRLEPIKKYVEVTDVSWAINGYTPNWVPTIQRVTTQPLWASQETADVVGGLESYMDETGFLSNFNKTEEMETGKHSLFQDYSDIDQSIKQTASDQNNLPQRGRDTADITEFTEKQLEAAEDLGIKESIRKINLNSRQLYVEDAMPPNGLPFTEGDEFITNPKDGDYHRLTYLSIDETIPARLFQFSIAKNRWVFKESDKRAKYQETKPLLQEFLGSKTRKPSDEISK